MSRLLNSKPLSSHLRATGALEDFASVFLETGFSHSFAETSAVVDSDEANTAATTKYGSLLIRNIASLVSPITLTLVSLCVLIMRSGSSAGLRSSARRRRRGALTTPRRVGLRLIGTHGRSGSAANPPIFRRVDGTGLVETSKGVCSESWHCCGRVICCDWLSGRMS